MPPCSDLEEDPLFSDLSPDTRLSSPDWLSCSPPPSAEHAKPDGKTEVHKIVNRSVSDREHRITICLCTNIEHHTQLHIFAVLINQQKKKIFIRLIFSFRLCGAAGCFHENNNVIMSTFNMNLILLTMPLSPWFLLSFLCLVPDEAKSSYQVEGTGYDTYLRDAHRQVRRETSFPLVLAFVLNSHASSKQMRSCVRL